MRYLRKFVQRVGYVSTLLIVGVLGGLMAPLSSEADNTTVTFQVDSGNVVTLLNVASGAANTCTQSGNTGCYLLTTGGQSTGDGPRTGTGDTRTFTSRNYLSSAAKLYMNDTNSLDSITLSTVEFLPLVTAGWGTDAANKGTGEAAPENYGERHVLRVVVTHTFNKTPHNSKTIAGDDATKYRFALRGSGMFIGNPTSYTAISGATGSGDYVKFEGVAKFGADATQTTLLGPVPASNSDGYGAWPACNTSNSKLNFAPSPPAATPTSTPRTPSSDVNYCPLRRTINTTTSPSSSFSSNPALEQVDVTGNQYPKYNCNNGTDCTPTVTLTFTATLNGPDSFVLSSSGDAAGGNCNHIRGGGFPSTINAINCPKTKSDKNPVDIDSAAADYFDAQDAADVPVFAAAGAEATQACVVCNCQDPNECSSGTIVIHKTTATNMEEDNSGYGPFPIGGIGREANLATTFNFTGVGNEITDFNITTAAGVGSMSFNGLTTGPIVRTITEAGFPTAIDPDGAFFEEPDLDAFWFTKTVSCVSTNNVSPIATDGTFGPTLWTASPGTQDQTYPTTDNRSGSVTVSNLANGDTLNCTFENGIYEPGE